MQNYKLQRSYSEHKKANIKKNRIKNRIERQIQEEGNQDALEECEGKPA